MPKCRWYLVHTSISACFLTSYRVRSMSVGRSSAHRGHESLCEPSSGRLHVLQSGGGSTPILSSGFHPLLLLILNSIVESSLLSPMCFLRRLVGLPWYLCVLLSYHSSHSRCLRLLFSLVIVVCIAGGRRFAGGRRRVEEKTDGRRVTRERRGVTMTKTTEDERRRKTMGEVSGKGSGVTNPGENHRRNVVAFNGRNRDMRNC